MATRLGEVDAEALLVLPGLLSYGGGALGAALGLAAGGGRNPCSIMNIVTIAVLLLLYYCF